MIDLIVGIIVLLAAVFILIASVGIVRFDNLYARMHVVTKVSSFALMLLLLAINILFMSFRVLVQTLIIFHVLIFLSPVSAHVIAKISHLLKRHNPENDNDVGEGQKEKIAK